MSQYKVLSHARDKLKMTQADVARMSGMDRPTYTRYEAGDPVNPKYVRSLCKTLDISPNELYEWKSPEFEELCERLEKIEKEIERMKR